jgi:formylglycine-generating enzyme required for sulfatase activity
MNRTFLAVTLAAALGLLSGCDEKTAAVVHTHSAEDNARLQQFIEEVKSQLVFVQGGEFLMGDFGEKYGREHLQYDSRQDSKPLHRVELTSYSLSKFKASNQQYQFYLAWNGLKAQDYDWKLWREGKKTPDTPAHVDWNEAEQYCSWLAKVTELPFALPTEAQWEYAARSRGKYLAAPTDDGTLRIDGRKGINVATDFDRKAYATDAGTGLEYMSPTPGDFRPPNPLGIYDLWGNGWEWVKDWYDPDYYKKSPQTDPQGPGDPVFKDRDGYYTKVLRSQDFSSSWGGLTMVRYNADPQSRKYPPADKTVRCAVNSSTQVK